MQNYFQLFSLENKFGIDKHLLTTKYQELLLQFHPDKFVNKSKEQQSQALQNTAILNTAYHILDDDLSRAAYILGLVGIEVFDELDTHMDNEFLISQIQYREDLEDLSKSENIEGIEDFIDKISLLIKQHITDIADSFVVENLKNVKNLVRQLRFYQQLKAQANELLDELE